jgi:hypothetical protein
VHSSCLPAWKDWCFRIRKQLWKTLPSSMERRHMIIDKYTGQLTNLLASVNMHTAHAFQHEKIGTSE